MSKRADFVICDSSPVLLIPDNLLLAVGRGRCHPRRQGRLDRLPRSGAHQDLLEGAGAQVLGVVLNQVPVGPLRKYYLRYYDSYVKAERK